MRRWILLGEANDEGTWFGSLDNEGSTLERVAHFTSASDEPTDEELSEHLEGRNGEWLLLPLDASRVIRSETTTSVAVDVKTMGVYS